MAGFVISLFIVRVPRFGVFVLAGKPNAGKSTLLNALIDQPLAITSPKPQSTRLPVIGIPSTSSARHPKMFSACGDQRTSRHAAEESHGDCASALSTAHDIALRAVKAWAMVTPSAYSRSPPTGSPRAILEIVSG